MDVEDGTCNKDLLSLIGNTPVINIMASTYPYANVKIKLESYNPGESIKDRVALKIIVDAEFNKQIEPGFELVEATSGNTGIGIAWIGRLKGYKVTIITHDKISKEKLALLKFHSANVIIASSEAPADSINHYVNIAREYSKGSRRFFVTSLIITLMFWLITIVRHLSFGLKGEGKRILLFVA